MDETFLITSELSGVIQDGIKEGYTKTNIVDPNDFYASGKSLEQYLKELIVIKFADEEISFLEERDELRPTNYLKNSRPLKTFVVIDSSNKQHTFTFDVASCS